MNRVKKSMKVINRLRNMTEQMIRFSKLANHERKAIMAVLFASSLAMTMAVAPIVVESFKTSDSYRIVGQIIGSTGGLKTSTSYNMAGAMKERATGVMTGTTYSISGGTVCLLYTSDAADE